MSGGGGKATAAVSNPIGYASTIMPTEMATGFNPFSGGGGGQSKNQVQTTQTLLDPQTVAMHKYASDAIQGAYEGGYNPYEGERYAGFNADQLKAHEGIRQMQGMGQEAYAKAGAIGERVGSYTPQEVQAEKLADADLSKFRNMYQGEVIDRGITSMDRARQMALEGESARAAQGGNINNERFGLQRGAINSDFVRNVGDFAAQQQAQNYQQAMGYANQDINRQFSGDQFNVNAGMAGQQMNLAGANQMMNSANQGRQAKAQDLSALNQVGAQQMALDQANKDFDYQQFQMGSPEQRIQMLLPLLGVQGGQTTTQTGPEMTNNPLGAMFGGALSGASVGGMAGGPWGALAGAGLGAAGGYATSQY